MIQVIPDRQVLLGLRVPLAPVVLRVIQVIPDLWVILVTRVPRDH